MQNVIGITKNDWAALVMFLAVCFAVAGAGAIATTPEIPVWYAGLKKPAWTPPNWLFGPVWGLLYAGMATAAWLVRRRVGSGMGDDAIIWFFVQLGLNLAWSFIFFKLRNPAWAFGEIVLLWLAIIITLLKFAEVSKAAAYLMAPYLLWVTYASALNFAIWRLND